MSSTNGKDFGVRWHRSESGSETLGISFTFDNSHMKNWDK